MNPIFVNFLFVNSQLITNAYHLEKIKAVARFAYGYFFAITSNGLLYAVPNE